MKKNLLFILVAVISTMLFIQCSSDVAFVPVEETSNFDQMVNDNQVMHHTGVIFTSKTDNNQTAILIKENDLDKQHTTFLLEPNDVDIASVIGSNFKGEIFYSVEEIVVRSWEDNSSYLFKLADHPVSPKYSEINFDKIIDSYGLGKTIGALDQQISHTSNKNIIIIVIPITDTCVCIDQVAGNAPGNCRTGGWGVRACIAPNCMVRCPAGKFACCNYVLPGQNPGNGGNDTDTQTNTNPN